MDKLLVGLLPVSIRELHEIDLALRRAIAKNENADLNPMIIHQTQTSD
ncbi:MAG: hypothetical protein M2R45_00983 [Verrucomicrobia subdivision 3 bacterium]|nr:hypothetical protein [Limisphaerales bacterium]MCS1414650.1 hypothetical protein [Limisphaerales bacterium]